MNKEQFYFIALLVFFANSIFSQNATLEIVDLQPKTPTQVFPKIIYPHQPKIADKINAELQQENLEHLPGDFEKDPFEKVRFNENDCCAYVNFYEWKKYNTSPQILSLKISGEAAGVYPEPFDWYCNFDLVLVEKILPDDLFSNNGLQRISKLFNQKIKTEIKQFVEELTTLKNKEGLDLDDLTYLEDQIEMYEYCLDWIIMDTVVDNKFYLTSDCIVFLRGRCSNHAMRAIDDLGIFKMELNYTDIKADLSDNGLRLIFNE